MGNKQGHCCLDYVPRFLPQEQAEVDRLFYAITGGLESLSFGKKKKSFSAPISLEMLQAYLKDAIPKKMILRIYEGIKNIELEGNNLGSNEFAVKEQFVIFLSELLKGNAGSKSTIIMKMLLVPLENVKEYHIQEFTEDLVSSTIHVLEYRKELKGWSTKKNKEFSASVMTLSNRLLSVLKESLQLENKQNKLFNIDVIEKWLLKVPQISSFLNVMIRQGFLILHSQEELAFLPECNAGKEFTSLLNIPAILYINSHLPLELRRTWSLIFSSQMHGFSFARLCGNIINKGPCLLVLKDKDGYVFGGFASHSWTVKGHFQGDSRSFLFSVFPTLEVYTYSGYNDNFMYLNHGQQTIPNGLGMGGQFNYFGLWIDYDFGKGHSRANPKCTTFNSPQLSSRENFEMDSLEVWAVGEVETEKPSSQKSILAHNPEMNYMLEMIGKSQ